MFRYIALELCQFTLHDYVQGKCDKSLIEPLEILRQATAGLAHLHLLDIGKRTKENLSTFFAGFQALNSLLFVDVSDSFTDVPQLPFLNQKCKIIYFCCRFFVPI